MTNPSPPTARFTLDRDTYLAFLESYWDHSALGRRGTYVISGLMGAFGLWLALSRGWLLGWALIFLCAVLVGMVFLRRKLWGGAFDKQLSDIGEMEMTFTDDHMRVTLNTGENRDFPWTRFDGYADLKDVVVLVEKKKPVSVIPWISVERPEALRSLLAEKLPAKRKRRL